MLNKNRFVGSAEEIYSPRCNQCKYRTKGILCKAFPKGIPDEILTGKNNHTKPLPEQKNDIVFKEIK